MPVYNDLHYTTKTWSVSGALITCDGNTYPMYATQLQFTHSRNISPINPINTLGGSQLMRINLAAAPQGQLTIASLIGPTLSGIGSWVTEISKTKDCDNPVEHSFDIVPFNVGDCPSTLTYRIKGAVLQQVQFTIQEQNGIAIVSQPLSFMFTELEIDG